MKKLQRDCRKSNLFIFGKGAMSKTRRRRKPRDSRGVQSRLLPLRLAIKTPIVYNKNDLPVEE